MKAIVCEMCGSNDVLKDGDFYVCQVCGTKYTPENARKLMVEVEGKVDVSGSSVKVDTTDSVKRALENARRAKQKEDWEETEKYYDLVERDDPSNIEAIFYSAYAKAKNTLTSDDVYRRQTVFKSFGNSISIIDDNFDVEKEPELRSLIDQMIADIIALSGSTFVYTITKNGYGQETSNNAHVTHGLFTDVKKALAETLLEIAKKLKAAQKPAAALYCVKAKALFANIRGNLWDGYSKTQWAKTAEVLSGVDNKAAFDTYREVADVCQKGINSVNKERRAQNEAFLKGILQRMKALDPSFDMEAELKQAENNAQKGQKRNKKSAIIAISVCGVILIGTAILILHIFGVF